MKTQRHVLKIKLHIGFVLIKNLFKICMGHAAGRTLEISILNDHRLCPFRTNKHSLLQDRRLQRILELIVLLSLELGHLLFLLALLRFPCGLINRLNKLLRMLFNHIKKNLRISSQKL
ncbi:hypothetical protein D3C87_1578210 [compost metagenome]